jgi:hypothetical protein
MAIVLLLSVLSGCGGGGGGTATPPVIVATIPAEMVDFIYPTTDYGGVIVGLSGYMRLRDSRPDEPGSWPCIFIYGANVLEHEDGSVSVALDVVR